MTKLSELLAARQALEQQISELRKQARNDAIQKVHLLMTEHGLTAEDLGNHSKARKKQGVPVAVKYRDQQSGQTWSGRGLQPKWLKAALVAGANLEDFKI